MTSLIKELETKKLKLLARIKMAKKLVKKVEKRGWAVAKFEKAILETEIEITEIDKLINALLSLN